jgi:hypothetical protein
MLSGKLVHLVETHGDDILTRVLEAIRRDPTLVRLRALVDREHRECAEDLLRNLGRLMGPGPSEDLAIRFEQLGRLRFEQEIPLHESVRALCLVREKTMDFVEEHITSNSSVELYSEEQFERRLDRLFDWLLVQLVRGYERALRKSAAA